MNKNGFTLVEIMAVLILLAVLIGISVTGVLNARDKANQKLEDSADAPIIAAAREYVRNGSNSSNYAAGSGPACVAVSTLITEGFLEDPIIENNEKLNDKVRNKYVKITLDSNYNYKYSIHTSSSCS